MRYSIDGCMYIDVQTYRLHKHDVYRSIDNSRSLYFSSSHRKKNLVPREYIQREEEREREREREREKGR